MEKEKLESLLIDYIDNKLNSVDRRNVEQELISNTEAYKLYEELKEVIHVMDRSARLEPSAKLKANFDKLLKDELASASQSKTIFFQPVFYRMAAAIALLIIGGGIGFFISKQNDARILAIAEKVRVQEEQMENMREMMGLLNNDQSASQRMQGVKVVYKMEKADDEILNALVKTMNEDPSSNVRLAALEALGHFVDEPQVRKALVNALAKQKDPIVQISLIQLLVKMKEKGVVKDLQKIVNDEGTIQAVKDEAYSGIMKLS